MYDHVNERPPPDRTPMLYPFLKNLIVGPLVRLLFRPTIAGAEHLPERGAMILASNHLSFLDPVFLPVMVRRPISFLAKSEYFTGRGVKGWLVRRFFLGIRQLPMDRSGGQGSSESLGAGLAHLRAGGLLGIYPEGTRSPDGRLYRGRTGVARVLFASGAPVVPVAMIDSEKVMPPGSRRPRIHRISIRIGRPIDLGALEGREPDGAALREVTDRIMAAIHELSGQTYVDGYAPRRVRSA
jgi:1-acyl-sn-glycerol-3-phosphate acyltransferase